MDHYHTTNSWANTATFPTEGIDTGSLRRCKTVGVARSRAFEVGSAAFGSLTASGSANDGLVGVPQIGAHDRTSTFHHYIFDVRMLTKLTITAASGKGFDATHFLHNGARIKGSSSGATGIVYIAPQDKVFEVAGCTTAANTTLVVPSTAGLEVGMGVSGTNVPAGTYISSIEYELDTIFLSTRLLPCECDTNVKDASAIII